MSEIEGIWKTYKQGTSSKCESERFAILSMDDFRWKAIVLPELGGDLSGNNWYIGDVRAFFESTSDPSVFASDWFFPISNDSREKRVFETFVSVDKGKLNVQYEDLNYGCVYIKLFPNTSYESTFQPTSEDSDELVGAGSCVLIDAKCKLFATNAHVVESSSRIALSYNGKEFAAIVVAIDEANDLAVLRAEQFDLEVKPAVLSMGASLGAEITAVGYPRITEMGEDVKLTEGIISAMTFLKNPTMYQISCPITNGNSGGGLFDNRGRLVGLTTAGWRPDETTENVNGAVKTSMIINLLSTIASCETQLEIDVTSSLEDAVRSVGIVRVFAPK
ncbi:serine protease [Flavobacteriales bacterium]|nr:serine protease [Flavobacteriales bacterium]